MGCCGYPNCVKTAFKTMTTLILVFGLVFVVVGTVLFIMADEVGNFGDEMKEDVKEYAKDILPEEVRKHVYKEDEFLKIDLNSLISSMSFALVIFGGFFVVISVAGCIFACWMKWPFFVIYLAVWLTIGTIYIVIVISVPGFMEDMLREELQTYAGFTDFSISGVTWTGIMIYFKCCGMENYRDFHKLDYWPNTDLNKINLLALHPGGNQAQEFKEAVDNLNQGNDKKYTAAELDAISDKINNAQNLTDDEKKIKEQLDSLPVKINFKNLTINLNASKFVTPLACCKWDPDHPDLQGKLIEGCNLEGLANKTYNNMDKACPAAIVDYISTGNGYVNGVVMMKGVAIAAFVFIVKYCLWTGLMIFVSWKSSGKQPVNKSTANEKNPQDSKPYSGAASAGAALRSPKPMTPAYTPSPAPIPTTQNTKNDRGSVVDSSNRTSFTTAQSNSASSVEEK